MRTKKLNTPAQFDKFFDSHDAGSVGWNEPLENLLQAVDSLLKPHGLEVLVADCGTDHINFSIEKRKTKKK